MKNTTNPALHRLAETLGVTVKRHTGGGKGYYDAHTHTITTRRGMSIQQYKSTLAHELAHAMRKDVPIPDQTLHRRNELRVDRVAANILINEESFHDAVKWHQGHLPSVADELEVTLHLLTIWIERHHNGKKYNP